MRELTHVEVSLIQKHYGNIDFDFREKDIVQMWQGDNVVQIEREKIDIVMAILAEKPVAFCKANKQ